MDANDPASLSVVEAARRIADGTLSPTALLEACLQRIAARDEAVRAWVYGGRDGRARDRARAHRGGARGPPARTAARRSRSAIKDIFHVAGMTTTCGAAPAFHTAATADAAAVARLRAAGAIVLGKAHTTEFAYFEPGPTRNPWNPAHTPGGSSSGSAAAVAARMAPLALGTQTVGSVLRPAAYCGVVGFKGTLRPDPDRRAWCRSRGASITSGVFARRGRRRGPRARRAGRAPARASPRRGRRAWRWRPELLERATPEVAALIRATAERFARAGATVSEVTLPAVVRGRARGGPLGARGGGGRVSRGAVPGPRRAVSAAHPRADRGRAQRGPRWPTRARSGRASRSAAT